MKQLELSLNKRLLIVERELHIKNAVYLDNGEQHSLKFLCKGPDFTEGIAKGLVHQSIHTGLFAHYVKGIPVNTFCYKTALESFESGLSTYGFHWGENPVKHPENMDIIPASFGWWLKQTKKHDEAESRTFNLEKTIIFEIL